MEKVKFSYSLKNIPLPTKDSNQKNLICKLEIFIKRIRWKVPFIDKNSESNKQLNNKVGFKSVITLPKKEHLNTFENNLYDMVQNIEFKNLKSSFQDQLQNNAKRIKQDPKLLIPADKTNTLYRLTTDEYNKLLTKNISKTTKELINLH